MESDQKHVFGPPNFAYVVVRVGVKDPQGIEAYLKEVRPILAAFGGEFPWPSRSCCQTGILWFCHEARRTSCEMREQRRPPISST